MSENVDQFEQERQNLLVFVWKNRKTIGIITAIGLVVSLVISLVMTPIFLSTAIVFPTATSTVSFSEGRNAKASSMDFGHEDQAEQMVQILQSASLRDNIVKEFGLFKHYEIEENDPHKRYKLVKKFDKNFKFARTRFGSIQIDVYDKDPQKAADMANRIVDLIDTLKNELIHQRTLEAFKISQRKRAMLLVEIDSISARVDSLTAIGIMSNDGRSGLYQALVDSKSQDEKNEIKERIRINKEYGPLYDRLTNIREHKISAFETFTVNYEQAESDANVSLNHKLVVERAVVSDKKEYPKRAIVVLLGTIGTLIFAIFILLLRQKLLELKRIV